MQEIDLLFLAIGLSMDSFAVSICQGVKSKKINIKMMIILGIIFGMLQSGMPFIGYLLGSQFESFIVKYDHWIAFMLLLIIGGKMIYEGFTEENEIKMNDKFNIKELLLLGIATSIDALALGITFPALNVNILDAVIIIGVVTFVVTNVGMFIGNKCGIKFKDRAEMLGGIILVGIGTKILLEHLNIF